MSPGRAVCPWLSQDPAAVGHRVTLNLGMVPSISEPEMALQSALWVLHGLLRFSAFPWSPGQACVVPLCQPGVQLVEAGPMESFISAHAASSTGYRWNALPPR